MMTYSDEADGPSRWVRIELGELFDIVSGGTPSTKRQDYWGSGYPWITSADIDDSGRITPRRAVTQSGVDNSATNVVPAGTVIVVTRVAVGKVAVAPTNICFSQDSQALLPKARVFDARFVQLQLRRMASQLRARSQGTTISGVTKGTLTELELVVPSLVEQRAIVAKIEQLFSELDKGIEQLETVKQQLKQYRQAVLKAAFEGKLTAEWRAEQQAKGNLPNADELLEQIKREREERYQQQLKEWKQAVTEWEAAGGKKSGRKKPRKPGAPDEVLPFWSRVSVSTPLELPEQWRWIRVADIGEVKLGRQRSPKNVSKDYPTSYVRAANITENGLDLSDLLEMEFTPDERETYGLRIGDILLSEASGSPDQVGKPAVWKGELGLCCFQNTVIRLRPDLPMSEYLLWVFRYCYHCGSFAEMAGGVGINHLSASKFAQLGIPLPPIDEQTEIVNRLESGFSVLAELDKAVDQGLHQAETLRQSILKKAFEGRLLSEAELAAVRNDPEYEPADKLLARIKAEREQDKQSSRAKSARKGTRRRTLSRPQKDTNETASEAK